MIYFTFFSLVLALIKKIHVYLTLNTAFGHIIFSQYLKCGQTQSFMFTILRQTFCLDTVQKKKWLNTHLIQLDVSQLEYILCLVVGCTMKLFDWTWKNRLGSHCRTLKRLKHIIIESGSIMFFGWGGFRGGGGLEGCYGEVVNIRNILSFHTQKDL